MDSTLNPFTNRGVITDPNDFFGREDQLNEIFTRLQGMQSCSVVGERGIGKSSLLYYLKQKGAQELGEAYRFFYLDLQDALCHTATGFLQAVLSKVGGTVENIKADDTLNQNLIAFSDEIDKLERAGQRIVLCLDEFENAFKHREQFTEDFFDHMRSQLNIRKLACVTATQRPLQELSLEGKLTSPFYTLFTVVELKELTQVEAQRFVEVHGEKVHFTDAESSLILTRCSELHQRHPLKLQIVGDWVIRNRQRQLSEQALTEEIAKEITGFFVGTFDFRQFRRLKKFMSLERIKKVFDTIKTGRGAFRS